MLHEHQDHTPCDIPCMVTIQDVLSDLLICLGIVKVPNSIMIYSNVWMDKWRLNEATKKNDSFVTK